MNSEFNIRIGNRSRGSEMVLIVFIMELGRCTKRGIISKQCTK